MDMHSYRPEWLEKVRAQESILRGTAMTADQAFALAGIIRRRAIAEYGRGVAMRVIMNGALILSHHMDGTDLENDWWMDKKLNTSRAMGMSSIRALMEIGEGCLAPVPELDMGGSYALCGGCFPWRDPQGRLVGYIETSGLAHENDHMLLVDSVAELMGVEIPRF